MTPLLNEYRGYQVEIFVDGSDADWTASYFFHSDASGGSSGMALPGRYGSHVSAVEAALSAARGDIDRNFLHTLRPDHALGAASAAH